MPRTTRRRQAARPHFHVRTTSPKGTYRLITLLAIAATEGFDLHTAATDKWAVVTGRDATAHRAPNHTDAA
jgi:hypothetical protein